MSTHARLLLALAADPLHDDNRLVYADWLEEHGCPLADLPRLQVRIRSLSEKDPRVLDLAAQEQTILHAHDAACAVLSASLVDYPEAQSILEERVVKLSRRHPTRFDCPACHADRAFRLDARNPMILHWMVNPGLAFNELVLGQRVPAVMLVCRGCTISSVRCIICRRLHPQSVLDIRPFGNWAGLNCPDCGDPIPMLRNLLAGAVVGLGRLAVGVLTRRSEKV